MDHRASADGRSPVSRNVYASVRKWRAEARCAAFGMGNGATSHNRTSVASRLELQWRSNVPLQICEEG